MTTGTDADLIPPPGPVAPDNGLYAGTVWHKRLRPRLHSLKYRMFMVLADLDQIDGERPSCLSTLSFNRFNLFSLYQKDHGPRDGSSVRAYVEAEIRAAGLDAGAMGAIRLLTMPRVLGYGFNPLSVYFIYRPDGGLLAILYEVRNTFGQMHSYLIPVPEGQDGVLHQSCDKVFYVSPFMPMGLRYHFRLSPPGDQVGLYIDTHDAEGSLLVAAFQGARQPLNDAALMRAFWAIPLLGLKVMAGIHWEAVKIVLKKFRFFRKPPLPATPVTLGTPD